MNDIMNKYETFETRINGVHSIFENMKNTLDENSTYISIHFFNFNGLNPEIPVFNKDKEWSFGKENFNQLMEAAIQLEGDLYFKKIHSILVHLREEKNSSTLLYRFLITKDKTWFLTEEDSKDLDNINSDTFEEQELQEGHIYLDSDFFQVNEKEYVAKKLSYLLEDSITKSLIEIFDNHEVKLEKEESINNEILNDVLKQYSLKNKNDLEFLIEDFFDLLYPEKSNNSLRLEKLEKKKDKLISILLKKEFKNKNNNFLIENINKYFEIFELIGISKKTTPIITLPKFGNLELVLKLTNGYADLIINIEENTIKYYEDMHKGDSIEKEYTISNTNLIKLKNILKTKF